MASGKILKSALAQVDEAELITLTRDLVRIPSVVRPADPSATEATVAEHVERWLAKEGFDVEVQPAAPARPNVIASFGEASPRRTLLLEGHTDVVTEGDPAEWRYPPFGGELADGRIWGRGAADMKGGLAASIVAVRCLQALGVRLRGDIIIESVVDEEMGGSNGTLAARLRGESIVAMTFSSIAIGVVLIVVAIGIAIAIALVRGFARRSTREIGNFWVDLTRAIVYILLPLSLISALVLVWQGTAFEAESILVLTLRDGGIEEITAFRIHELFPLFGLAEQLPTEDTTSWRTP